MKLLMWILLFSICLSAFGQELSSEIGNASKNALFKGAADTFAGGKYQSTITELNAIEQKFKESQKPNRSLLGLTIYWKGVCYNRLQEFPEAIASFDEALGLDFTAQDIHYEYGQALFAAEKLSDARIQFRESLKKKFKRAVSLYYIAFISKELGEKKKAVTFYKAIQKLDAAEAMEVRQAAEMQIGDIYLEQVEKHPDAFRAVESYVIPQYQLAYDLDKSSGLAPEIQGKIVSLQRKYDLVLFKLRNGRPTLTPPYFARIALEYGQDSNVVFSPTEQSVSESKKRSGFAKTDLMGRYTFYHRDFFSVSPELRFNYTRYLNRVPEIYRNDNFLIAPAIRTAYEHHLWDKPASVLFDYDYGDGKRDVNAEEKLEFSFRSHTLMLGERFNFFTWGESIVRLRRRIFDSYVDTSDSNTTSFVYEQVRNFTTHTVLVYASYDMSRVESDVFDTNSFTLRGDLIMGRYKEWFSPSFGLGITRTKPLNDDDRGVEYLFNPSARLAKNFKKNWRGSLKFDYQDYKSDDEENFAYKKYVYSFELEYVF
jgi:tetratricopeptide (TPR) repeat protein